MDDLITKAKKAIPKSGESSDEFNEIREEAGKARKKAQETRAVTDEILKGL